MIDKPQYKSVPTFRNYEDYHDAEQYTCGYDAEYRGEIKRVVHAYWIEREKRFIGDYGNNWNEITRRTIMCSDCGAEIAGGSSLFKYCPECGAKMDLKPRGAIEKYKLMTGWMKEKEK